jgi:hypothetical protein
MLRSATESATNPLTLGEQLDAMLLGWLEHRAATRGAVRADALATTVVTVAQRLVPQVEAFCERWQLEVRHTVPEFGGFTVLSIRGRSLPVQGFTEITAMYRS